MAIDQETLQNFFEEFKSNIDICESNLVQLGDDNVAGLSEMYRSMHSLKGAAMFVQAPKITELSHQAEELLNSLATDATHQDSNKLDWDFLKTIFLKILEELNKNMSSLQAFGTEDEDPQEHILAEIKEASVKCGVMRDKSPPKAKTNKKKRKLNKLQEKILQQTQKNREEQKEEIAEENTKISKVVLQEIQEQIANLNYIKNNLLQEAESKGFYDKSLTALNTATERLNKVAIEANLAPL